MDTQITLADVRAALYTEVDASNPSAPLFLQRLNEVRERLIYSGKWKGEVMGLNLPATQMFVTLPRQYLSILSSRYRRRSRLSFTPFQPFSEEGYALPEEATQFRGYLTDMGDGFVTQSDITTAGTLRVTISGAGDAAKSIRLYGLDENGNEVFDSTGVPGITITTADPIADTTVQFSQVTGIQAPVMTLPWLLSVVNDSVATQIGAYQPGETRPSYRRYHTGETTDTIYTLCQRRYLPLVNETDWVIPGNMSALRYGLQMMAFEYAGEQDKAEAAFNGALRFLNNEAKASRGGATPPVIFNTEFSHGVDAGA